MIEKIKKLNKEGLILLDMHSHTNLSDGSHTWEEAIQKAEKEGFNICITDHNEIKASIKIQNNNFTLYGSEITTSDVIDVLVYFSSPKTIEEFYKKYIEKAKIKEKLFKFHKSTISTAELLDYAKDYNALIIVAHPQAHHPKRSYEFFNKNSENKLLLRKVDAIEGFNSMMPKNANYKSIKWAEEIKKPIIASSDAHSLKYLGYGLTACYANTKDDFITQIIKNKSMIYGKEIPLIKKILEGANIIYKNLILYK